jgi:PAS domain S-box-containing protein
VNEASTGDKNQQILRAIIESPHGIVIFALDREYRYLAFNEAHRQTMIAAWGKDIAVGDSMLGVVTRPDDQARAKGHFERALRGEHFVAVAQYGEEKRSRRTFENVYAPIVAPDGSIGGLTCFTSDITEQRRAAEELEESRKSLERQAAETANALTHSRALEADLAERNEQLAARATEHVRLVEQLRLAVDELSTPVLEVWDDVIVMPIVGIVDTQRGAQMMDRVLSELVQHGSRFVIVDLTGVATVDTSTADRFIKLAHAVRLLGAECIVTGIQPAVSQTLVTIGVEFGGFSTQRNLKQALEYCMRSLAGDLGMPRSADNGKQLPRAR